MSASVLAAAMTALVAEYTAALTPLGFQVIDGIGYDPGPSFLAVGWDREDAASVSFTFESDDGGDVTMTQDYTVSSLLSVYLDANEVTSARNTLLDALQAMQDALAADRTLGGAVMKAHITDGELTPYLTNDGAAVEVRFVTHIQAFG